MILVGQTFLANQSNFWETALTATRWICVGPILTHRLSVSTLRSVHRFDASRYAASVSVMGKRPSRRSHHEQRCLPCEKSARMLLVMG